MSAALVPRSRADSSLVTPFMMDRAMMSTATPRATPATEIQVVYGSTEAEPIAHIGADEILAEAAAATAAATTIATRNRNLIRTRLP